MYIQLTSNCNMSCDHCCMSTSVDIPGVELHVETVKRLMDFAIDCEMFLSVGGGEPTIYSAIDEVVGYYINKAVHIKENTKYGFDGNLWMATNGLRHRTVNRLLDKVEKLAYMYPSADYLPFTMALSLDDWHSAIPESIEDRFRNLGLEIRTVKQEQLSYTGFAAENYLIHENDKCCCSSLMIMSNGDVKLCGCDASPVVSCIAHPNDVDMFKLRYERIYQLNDYEEGACYRDIDEDDMGTLKAIWSTRILL